MLELTKVGQQQVDPCVRLGGFGQAGDSCVRLGAEVERVGLARSWARWA